MKELPKRMLIVGGGYIAVEFACIFHGLGVEVDLAYRGELFLRGFDKECREFLAESMSARGINVMFNTNVTAAEKNGSLTSVTLTDGSVRDYGVVLSATGRSPALENLGLENCGVVTDKRGYIEVDENYKTSTENIYAVGDCTATVQLTPVALGEGMYLAHHLFGDKDFPRPNYKSISSTIFSHPEMAVWGLSEEDAREEFAEDLDVYTSKFRPMKNILAGSDEKMFMKMLVRKSNDEIVGLYILGEECGEIMQGFAVALAAGVTKKGFDSTIGIHPTAAEELVTMRTPTR